MMLPDDTPNPILLVQPHLRHWHDKRSSPANTDAVAGAEHVHFHHLVGDVRAAPSRDGKRPGVPCEVEMVCHACHASARIRFRVTDIEEGVVLHGDKVERVRNEFVQSHVRCSPERGADYKHFCDKRRQGAPKTFDFSGTGS